MTPAAVLVAGGAGFLGSHLCARLLDLGQHVVAVDNLLTGSTGNLEHLLPRAGFRFHRADICDDDLDDIVAGPVRAVVNLASPASPVAFGRYPLETMRAGSLGTQRTLDLAVARRARYLLASTSETYGDPLVHPQREDYWGNVNPIGPRSVYDEAKRYAEALVTAYRRTRGADTAIARIFNTYGPRLRPDDGRVVPTFIDQALDGRPLTVAGDGGQTRSMCYVSDLVDGLVRLLRSSASGPVNLGNPREVTMLHLARRVVELTGSASPITFVPLPQDDPRARRPDVDLARRALGWAPRVGLDEGLTRTIASMRTARPAAALARTTHASPVGGVPA